MSILSSGIDAFLEAIASESSTHEIARGSELLSKSYGDDELLSTYRSYDLVQSTASVLHGADGVDYLVYPSKHPNSGTEIRFQAVGFLAGYLLPSGASIKRSLHKPHTMMQKAEIVGAENAEFACAFSAISVIHDFFELYCSDGKFEGYTDRKIFGLPAIEASTRLLTKVDGAGQFEVKPIPETIDQTGSLASAVRRNNTWTYTEDNDVQYTELYKPLTDDDKRLPTPLVTTSPGSFRQGQLVKISVVFRSVKSHSSKMHGPTRRMVILLRGLTILSRDGAMKISEIRRREDALRLTNMPPPPSQGGLRYPKKRRAEEVEGSEDVAQARDLTHAKMVHLSMEE